MMMMKNMHEISVALLPIVIPFLIAGCTINFGDVSTPETSFDEITPMPIKDINPNTNLEIPIYPCRQIIT